jgi:hypothetical protein
VDGSASNDSGHLLNEARQAMLLQRVAGGAGAMTPRAALRHARRGEVGPRRLRRAGGGPPRRSCRVADGHPASAGAWDRLAALALAPPGPTRCVLRRPRRGARPCADTPQAEITAAADAALARLMAA